MNTQTHRRARISNKHRVRPGNSLWSIEAMENRLLLSANLALNTAQAGYPSPLESNQGWGGGSYPWEIVDGLHSYDNWAHGLAFTGGHVGGIGTGGWIEPAGLRQTTVDLGVNKSFDKVVIWHHGREHTPANPTLEFYNGSAWQPIQFTRIYGAVTEMGSNSGLSTSDEYTFPAVTGSKVRYSFDNSQNNIDGTPVVHGWIYEFEVFESQTTQPLVVVNTQDNGPGSLREAILTANAHPGPDSIVFNIGTGLQTIRPLSQLPVITDPVIIDGTTQPGYTGLPLIQLNGMDAGAGVDGLRIGAGHCTLRGLIINRFSMSGVLIVGGGGNTIEGNYIGTDSTGTLPRANGGSGINIIQSSDNMIGGTSSASRNLISGNGRDGISISNAFYGSTYEWKAADGGNGHWYLTMRGTNWHAAEATAQILGGHLASINSAEEQAFINNSILVGYNVTHAFWIGLTDVGSEGSFHWTSGEPLTYKNWHPGEPNNAANEDFVEINWRAPGRIGTWNDRDNANRHSILEFAAPVPSLGANVSTNNRIIGNYIGTDITGKFAIANAGHGIDLSQPGATGNSIGGTTSDSVNIISGNGASGIHFEELASGNHILGNLVGVDATGTAPLSNGAVGIHAEAGSMNSMGTASEEALLVLQSLLVEAGGQLDLGDHQVVLRPTSQTFPAVANLIQEYLAAGRNGGLWNGPRIASSAAAADPLGITGVGVAVSGNDLLLKYTYSGDMDLNGLVDADDYFRIDSGFAASAAGYPNGDIDYSGVIDADDYFPGRLGLFKSKPGPRGGKSRAQGGR